MVAIFIQLFLKGAKFTNSISFTLKELIPFVKYIFIYIRGIIYLSEFDKRYLQKFQVRFKNLTPEVHKKHLKVDS